MAPNKCLVLCSAHNCYSTQHTSSLHKFPRNEIRAKDWAQRCGRPDFLNLIEIYGTITGNYRLCAKHFADDQFLNCNAKKKSLVHDAVPTIFDTSGSVDYHAGSISSYKSDSQRKIFSGGPSKSGVSVMSTRNEPHFTKVINVQADGDGEASSFLEGIYGDNMIAEESNLQDVNKVTVMENDELIIPHNDGLTESISSENYCRSSFRAKKGSNIRDESTFSISSREHRSSNEPSLSTFDSAEVFSRPKRKVGVVPLLEPWDMTREFCRKHGINYDSAVRCREQMVEWQQTAGEEIQHYTVQGHYSARGELLEGLEEGVDDDLSLDYKPRATPSSGRARRGRGRPRGRRPRGRGRPPSSSRLQYMPVRYRSSATDSQDELDPLFGDRPTRFDLGASPASSTQLRRGLYANKRGRPRMRPLHSSSAHSLSSPLQSSEQPLFADHCYYCVCKSGTSPRYKSSRQILFPFPKDPGRCSAWAENCGDKNLLNKIEVFGSSFVHRNFRLCPAHFLPQTFLEEGKSLFWNAVPTVLSQHIGELPHGPCYEGAQPLVLCNDSRCPNNDGLSSTDYFAFPSDPVRCALWVNYCGDELLVAHFNKFGSSYLSEHMHLCRDHFESYCFSNTFNTPSLRCDAQPTLFRSDVPPPSPPAPTVSSCGDPGLSSSADISASDSDAEANEVLLAEKRVSLTNKVLFLQEELDSLRADSSRQRAKLRYLKKNISQNGAQKDASYTLDDALHFCKGRLPLAAYHFFKVQMFAVIKPRWSAKSLELAILAARSGKNVYRTLSSMFRFPCHATIRRFRTAARKLDNVSQRNSDIILQFDSPTRERRTCKKPQTGNKSINKILRPELRKNKTVAQILEDFLDKRGSDINEHFNTDARTQTCLLSADGTHLTTSDAMSTVDSMVNSDNLVVTADSLSVGADTLVNPDSIVTTDNLVTSDGIVTSDMVANTLVVANPVGSEHSVPSTTAALLGKPLCQHVDLVASPHTSYIMNSMRMDGSITYMYDI